MLRELINILGGEEMLNVQLSVDTFAFVFSFIEYFISINALSTSHASG